MDYSLKHFVKSLLLNGAVSIKLLTCIDPKNEKLTRDTGDGEGDRLYLVYLLIDTFDVLCRRAGM